MNTRAHVQIRNLGYVSATGRGLQNVTLTVYGGEIFELLAAEGNSQTRLAEVLSGLNRRCGRHSHQGAACYWSAAQQMRDAGVGHIPRNRLTNGVALGAAIAENLVVDRYDRPPFAQHGVLRPGQIRQAAATLIRQLTFARLTPGQYVRSQAVTYEGDLSPVNSEKPNPAC